MPIVEEFKGNYLEYHQMLKTKYFPVCQNAKVLEITEMSGFHALSILENNPAHLTIIEADQFNVDRFSPLLNGRASIIQDDVNYALINHEKVDVVICFGLVYHLHSPLHLLELIVNCCDPEYIMLDTVGPTGATNNAEFCVEEVNTRGMQQTRPGFKSAGYKLIFSEEILNIALQNMGYTQLRSDIIVVSDNFSKSNTWAGIWKKELNKN